MRFKIALLGIYHESNTFSEELTVIENFLRGHYLKGEAIRREYEQAHHEIGGMIEVLDKHNIRVVPVMYAEATPGGRISSETYDILLGDMMSELENVLPVDGCMIVPHGAAVSEDFQDMDGHWLSLVREKLGKEIPIIGTLDPHANVSKLMIESTNALIAYATNPHVDQRETGKIAANLMVECLMKRAWPRQELTQLPLAISIEQQCTLNDPCKSLYGYVRSLEKRKGILSISMILGFPYADVEEMGSSVIVVSDGKGDTQRQTGDEIRAYITCRKEGFNGDKKNISSVLDSIDQLVKPVLMLDMGDNIGAGAPGDSAFLLEKLEEKGDCRCFICIYDPTLVGLAEEHDLNDWFDISLISDKRANMPYNISVQLKRLGDGRFNESNPRHGGQANFDMGKIAIVSTRKGNTIMLTSLRISPFSLKQLTAFGVDPSLYDVVIAKGVNAPIAAYSPVCPTILQVDTPGITQADMTKFSFKNRRKPLYPFEEI
ncbi:MAG: M81 family metallopeptidase [Chitinophagaceae bacterium]|nr:M81 family metallopeptidase [Chitinophagaceae bacterium]